MLGQAAGWRKPVLVSRRGKGRDERGRLAWCFGLRMGIDMAISFALAGAQDCYRLPSTCPWRGWEGVECVGDRLILPSFALALALSQGARVDKRNVFYGIDMFVGLGDSGRLCGVFGGRNCGIRFLVFVRCARVRRLIGGGSVGDGNIGRGCGILRGLRMTAFGTREVEVPEAEPTVARAGDADSGGPDTFRGAGLLEGAAGEAGVEDGLANFGHRTRASSKELSNQLGGLLGVRVMGRRLGRRVEEFADGDGVSPVDGRGNAFEAERDGEGILSMGCGGGE
jgi:hypothetical protein